MVDNIKPHLLVVLFQELLIRIPVRFDPPLAHSCANPTLFELLTLCFSEGKLCAASSPAPPSIVSGKRHKTCERL